MLPLLEFYKLFAASLQFRVEPVGLGEFLIVANINQTHDHHLPILWIKIR
jgi:hypothetical protein